MAPASSDTSANNVSDTVPSGERACCFLVLKPDAKAITLDDLRMWLSARDVAKLKWPERVEIIADMPMTPTRKVKKTELIAMLKDS